MILIVLLLVGETLPLADGVADGVGDGPFGSFGIAPIAIFNALTHGAL